MEKKEKEDSIIRTVFRNEFTWVISIIGFVWAFIVAVVLPIQKLQIQASQIQSQITAYSGSLNTITDEVQNIGTKQQVDETTLNYQQGEINRVFPNVSSQ